MLLVSVLGPALGRGSVCFNTAPIGMCNGTWLQYLAKNICLLKHGFTFSACWNLISYGGRASHLFVAGRVCGPTEKEGSTIGTSRNPSIWNYQLKVNGSHAVARSCISGCRKAWAGICYEVTWTELRYLTEMDYRGDGVNIVPAGGCFSEHVKFDLDNMHLSSRFYLRVMSVLAITVG
jgi:hypothetical protein